MQFSNNVRTKKSEYFASIVSSPSLKEQPVSKKRKRRHWLLEFFRRNWKCQSAHVYEFNKESRRSYGNPKGSILTGEPRCLIQGTQTTTSTTKTKMITTRTTGESTPERLVPLKLDLPIPIRRTLRPSCFESRENFSKDWSSDFSLDKKYFYMKEFEGKYRATPSTTHVTMSDASVDSLYRA